MKKAFVKVILLLGAAAAVTAAGYGIYKSRQYEKEAVPEAVEISTIVQQESQQTQESQEATEKESDEAAPAPEPVRETVPPSINLKLPFYAQAPFGNWDYPWQEACEEASVLLIANAYFEHDWSREQFNDEILKLVEWEKERFGDYWHTTMPQTAEILNDYLDLKTVIHDDPSYEDLQKILAKGHLIVMPFAGKRLGNPFYKNGGPMYHVMVVKGYKEGEKIITHDVGTRRGEDYVYGWETAYNAFHDYAVPMEQGARRFIEVLPADAAEYNF